MTILSKLTEQIFKDWSKKTENGPKKIKREKNMKDEFDDIYEEEEEDFFSPTSWDKDPFETDEEYIERIQDQEDWLESFDD